MFAESQLRYRSAGIKPYGARGVDSLKIGVVDVEGTGEGATVDWDLALVCATRASARETEKLIRFDLVET